MEPPRAQSERPDAGKAPGLVTPRATPSVHGWKQIGEVLQQAFGSLLADTEESEEEKKEREQHLEDLARGLKALREAAVVEWWWTAPPAFDHPPLGVEHDLAELAARRLAAGDHPARVARDLARRNPLYRHAVPEIVRAVLAAAQEATRRVA